MAKTKASRTATVAAAAVIALGAGGAIAYAAGNQNSGAGPNGYGQGAVSTGGYGGYGQGGYGGMGRGMGQGMGNHTAVTGDELAKVTDAVKAKDSAITVTKVLKDDDGSYDVFGTKAGAGVRAEVSSDLKTITVKTGGMGRGHGDGTGMGMGGGQHTAVTGTEATTVTNAVKAKDATITVSSVRKDADGSYDVLGTKAGSPVMVEVSKDLKTITVKTGGMGHGMGRGKGMGGTSPNGTPSQAPTAGSSTTT